MRKRETKRKSTGQTYRQELAPDTKRERIGKQASRSGENQHHCGNERGIRKDTEGMRDDPLFSFIAVLKVLKPPEGPTARQLGIQVYVTGSVFVNQAPNKAMGCKRRPAKCRNGSAKRTFPLTVQHGVAQH
mmetsp:Transcript_190/g.247  ORF Transcript_190/g.247 Transcript_190/m.247 type:complete len:131 (-) Transcript_190:122-514(-)